MKNFDFLQCMKSGIEQMRNQIESEYVTPKVSPFLYNCECHHDFFPNHSEVIDSEEALNQFLDVCKNKEKKTEESSFSSNVFFRGQKDAKWVCRSTLLRDYLIQRGEKHESFEDFRVAFEEYVARHHEENQNDLSLTEYNNNAQQLEVAAQHYDKKSSLIDFTRDIDIALWFAARGVGDWKENENCRISNYMCIISLEANESELPNLEKVRATSLSLVEESTSGKKEESLAAELISKSNRDDNSQLWELNHTMGYIGLTQYRPLSNPRIENQKGVLICLGCNMALSLEEVVQAIAGKAAGMSHIIVKFTYINKKLAGVIMQRLEKLGINKTSLGL